MADLEGQIRNVLKSVGTGAQKNAMRRFDDYNKAKGLTEETRVVQLRHVRDFVLFLEGKSLKKVTKLDVERYFAKLSDELAPATVDACKIDIKKFLWYVHGAKGKGRSKRYPGCVETIELTHARERIPVDNMPKKKDILRLLDAWKGDWRNRAIIALLYDSGIRAGELGGLRIRNVNEDGELLKIFVDGKTGKRAILLVESVPFLRKWLEIHPERDSPESPLFGARGKHKANGISVKGLRYVIRVASKRAGVQGLKNGKQWLSPHDMRHWRATLDASWMTEAQLCAKFGWEPGSRMPARYIHMSGRDLDDAIRQQYGLAPKEERKAVLEPVICLRCRESNEAGSQFCKRCGFSLERDKAESFQELAAKALLFDRGVSKDTLEKSLNALGTDGLRLLLGPEEKEPLVQLRMTPEMFEKFKKTFGVGSKVVEAEEQ